jgi:hypothetical protein
LVDGRWISDPLSDLGRTRRQEVVGQAALNAISRFDSPDPRRLLGLLDVLVKHVTLDDRSTVDDLVRLARELHGARIQPAFPSITDAVHDGRDALDLTAAGRGTIDDFVHDRQSAGEAVAPTAPPGPFDITAC